MNVRTVVHIIAAIAGAIVGGTVTFEGLPDAVNHDILAFCSLVILATTIYLASTSTGQNAASK